MQIMQKLVFFTLRLVIDIRVEWYAPVEIETNNHLVCKNSNRSAN